LFFLFTNIRVFVTKYRRKILTEEMITDMKQVFDRVLGANNSKLEELLGFPDHVHLLVDLHPDNNISDLIATLKSASSRILREKYKSEIDKYYWGKAKLWHDSKCKRFLWWCAITSSQAIYSRAIGRKIGKVGSVEPPTFPSLSIPTL